MPWLGSLLASLLGTSVARMLTGAGLAIVTFAGMTPLVLSALNHAADLLEGVGGSVLQIMLMCGAGEALSMLGSAIMTRVAIDAGKVALTKAAS